MRIITTLIGILLGLSTFGAVYSEDPVLKAIKELPPLNLATLGKVFGHGATNKAIEGLLPLDIVFLVDESGSMVEEQAAFQANTSIQTIYENLIPGSKAGLVGFGASMPETLPNIFHSSEGHVHSKLTSIQDDFQQAADELTSNGGREPSCEAITQTIEGDLNMGFRQDNNYCLVLLADEKSNDDSAEYTEQRAIDGLTNKTANEANGPGVFFGVVPTDVTEFFQGMADATGGEMFDMALFLETPDEVLQDVMTKCNVAVNRITIEPRDAVCTVGDDHQIKIRVIKEESGLIVPAEGETVTVTTTTGPDSGEEDTVTTDANGIATYTCTGRAGGGTDVIEACLEGDVCARSAQAQWIDEGLEIDLTPVRGVHHAGETHTVTAKVHRPGIGEVIEGKTVSLEGVCGPNKGYRVPAVTDNTGMATFEITSDEGKDGRDMLEACADFEGVNTCGNYASVSWIPGPGIRLEPATATRNIGTSHELTATVTRARGGTVVGVKDKIVTFRIATGPDAGETKQAITDADGVAKWQYTGHTEGSNLFEACFFDGADKICDGFVECQWQVPAVITLSPESAICEVGEAHQLTATVSREVKGQVLPLEGEAVAFVVTDGPDKDEKGTVLTDANGEAKWTCTNTGRDLGTSVYEACITDNGKESCTTSESVWELPVGISLEPATATLNIGMTLELTATIRPEPNGSDSGVADKEVTFSIVSGPNTGWSQQKTTNKDGVATCEYVGSLEGTTEFEACHEDNGEEICSGKVICVWEVPGEIELSPPTADCGIGDPHQLTATVTREINGIDSPLEGVAVTFEVKSGPNKGEKGTVVTDVKGEAKWTCTNSGDEGKSVFEACFDDNGETRCDTSEAEFEPGVGISLTPASATRNIGTTYELKATVRVEPNGSDGGVAGKEVTFRIVEGQDTDWTHKVITDTTGVAVCEYVGSEEGETKFTACFDDNGEEVCSKQVNCVWEVPAEIELSPETAVCEVGDAHELTAAVTRKKNGIETPLSGVAVSFKVKSGPDEGKKGTVVTESDGKAKWTCRNTEKGTDDFEACFDDNGDEECATSAAVFQGCQAKDVQRKAKDDICQNCVEASEVYDGSLDPEDGALELKLNPTCPFSLGTTPVELEVTTSAGDSFTCTASVTIVDETAPSAINCNAPEIHPPFDERHTFTATATDNCDTSPTVTVTSYDLYRLDADGKRVPSPTCKASRDNASIRIGKACVAGDHVDWTVKAVDDAGNESAKVCSIEIVGEVGISLEPASATLNIGMTHELTATVEVDSNGGVADKEVTFSIVSGPNADWTQKVTTNTNGVAVCEYVGSIEGRTVFIACFDDDGEEKCSGQVSCVWEVAAEIDLSPKTAVCGVGDGHELTATLTRKINGIETPLRDTKVDFNVTDGPDKGEKATVVTESNGEAKWTCTNSGNEGTSKYMACFDDNGQDRWARSEAEFEARPKAICRDVQRKAKDNKCQNCVKAFAVNDGSFDQIDGALTGSALKLNASCPFFLGTTPVELEVTNSAGASSTCTAKVKIVDETAPSTINCNAPETHVQLDERTTFTPTATDNCDTSPTVTVTSYDLYRLDADGTRVPSPTCKASRDEEKESIRIGKACVPGDHIDWTVKAVDDAGNESAKVCSMEIVEASRYLPQKHLRRVSQ